MKSLTVDCGSVNLSYNYDGLTIYPKVKLPFTFSLALVQCFRLSFVSSSSADQSHMQQMTNLLRIHTGVEFDKFINQMDVEHDFYHLGDPNNDDSYSKEKTHYHIKFKSILCEQQLTTILDILIKNNVINANEKNAFLFALNERHQFHQRELSDCLTGNQLNDIEIIMDFIKNCQNNDILINLHAFLATDKFDYLREIDTTDCTNWQSKTANGDVIKTSKVWAMIEKSFAFQLAKNLNDICDLSPKLAQQRANQLSKCSFFSMKRKREEKTYQNSKMFEAFSKGDKRNFQSRYENHFTIARKNGR